MDRLIIWDGTILDGNNRYEIIQKHPELTYAVHRLSFATAMKPFRGYARTNSADAT